ERPWPEPARRRQEQSCGIHARIVTRCACKFHAESPVLALPPLQGEVGEPRRGEPSGVQQHHPTPAARNMLAADPPPPGEGKKAKNSAIKSMNSRPRQANSRMTASTARLSPGLAITRATVASRSA